MTRAILIALALGLSGCSGEGQRAAAVDPPRAREALRTALESWKRGDKLESLKSASPPIIVQDFDWMAGLSLIRYEVTGDGKDDDANLRIPVTLTLQAQDGKEIQKKVRYVVGTSPSLTVFRDFGS
ncbi:MAG: hypothetical protein IRY99_04850 [Isosphaeraceae bacterium]|nr:hypothetical protein [Isosphaeraceae bacterium]